MLSLNVHSYYEYGESIVSIDDIIKKTKEVGEKYFCITDCDTLTSFSKAFFAAEKNGLTFIPGYEGKKMPNGKDYSDWKHDRIKFLQKEQMLKRTTDEMSLEYQKEIDELKSWKSKDCFKLMMLAYSSQGLNNLFDIYSNSLETGTEKEGYKYWLTDEILNQYKDGILFFEGNKDSELFYLVDNLRIDEARELITKYKNLFGDKFYIQLSNNKPFAPLSVKKEEWKSPNITYNLIAKLANEMSVKCVFANDVRYANKEDIVNYRLFLNSLNIGEVEFSTNGNHILSDDETLDYISEFDVDANEIIKNTNDIKNIIEDIHFPDAPLLKDCSEELTELVWKGWEEKRKGTEYEDISRDRIKTELDVINSKNFSEYFIKLIEIINAAKECHVLTGPARGSAAGSEICYLIGITKVDPLRYGLMFERFLNPGRTNYPDIDVDFASTPVDGSNKGKPSRDIIMQRLLDKGVFKFAKFVKNEVTSTTLVLFKSLAKYCDIPHEDVNTITKDEKYIEKLTEKEYTGWLKSAVNEYGYIWEDYWDRVEERIGFCYKLGGTPSNSSIAASAIIMCDVDAKLPVRHGAIGFNGHDLEDRGYIKYDMLIVTNLDMIQDKYGLDIDWNKNDDPKTWEVLSKGDTDFVFQFASPGMKKILTSISAKSIDDLAETNALYRPGPMDYIPQYIDLKNGREAELTPELNSVKVLLTSIYGKGNTSGLLLYQEDVMKICQEGSGFSLKEADDIRKGMSKKNRKLLDSYKPKFIDNWKFHNIVYLGENAYLADQLVELSNGSKMTAKEIYDSVQRGEEIDIKD